MPTTAEPAQPATDTTHNPAVHPRVCFVHIPKTAGTSLRTIAEQFYPRDRLSATSAAKWRLEQLKINKREMGFDEELSSRWCYAGHLNISGMLPESYSLFTMMRSPLPRLRSQFNHWVAWSRKEIEDSPSSPQVKALKHRAKEMSLEAFLGLSGGPIFRLFENGQCKTLVSNFPVPEQKQHEGRELAELACRRLDAMRVVGVTERFEDSVHLLCHAFGWPPPPRTERLNMRKRDRDRDHEDLSTKIRAAVELDEVAYAHALTRFEADHAAMLDDLSVDPDDDDRTDRVIARLDDRARQRLIGSGAPRERTVRITMSDGLRGVGWLELERTRTGHAYRWTGPTTRTTLDMLIEPAERYEVTVRVVSLLHRDVLKGARVRINGREASKTRVQWRLPFVASDPAAYHLNAVVDAHPVGDDGFCRVELLLPRTWRHEDIEPGCGDTREKGLAITGVTVRPA